MSRFREILRSSPTSSGRMRILLPAVVLVALFAVGLAIGAVLFDGEQPLRVRLGFDEPVALDDSDVTASLAGASARDMADQGEDPGASASGSNGTGQASTGASGSGAGTTADPVSSESGPSDARQAVVPPKKTDEPDPPSPASFLEKEFGLAAAPGSVAGMKRTAGPDLTGNVLEAEYAGGEAGDFDLLFLTVVKTNSPTAARNQADEFLHVFPVDKIEFSWGGRQVRQAMTDEGRPNQFPPLICMVWTDGSFAMRVVTAPLAPDRVLDARTSTLDFIGALPY